AFDPERIGDALDRIIGGRLEGHAAVPSRTGALHAIAAQRPRRRNVLLDIECWIVLHRLAGLRIEPLGPVQLVHILAALDEAAIVAIERVEEAVTREMGDDFAI